MMMTTTLMRSTVVTSFRPVAFHAMSSGNNGWSLDVRLRAVSGCRPGWQVVRRRALAFVGGSVYGAGDVGCADWRATMTLGDVGSFATVGDLALAGVLAATRYDDNATATGDLRRPRSPRYPGGDDACKTKVNSQVPRAVFVIDRRTLSFVVR